MFHLLIVEHRTTDTVSCADPPLSGPVKIQLIKTRHEAGMVSSVLLLGLYVLIR